MSARYACPGVDTSRHGTVVHLNSCCVTFALASDERRAETGVRRGGHEQREELPRPLRPETITVPELAQVVAGLIARAAQFPDEEPPGATVWVQYGPEHTEADVQALYDLGHPYNLVLGRSRVHHTEGSTT